MDSLVHRNIIKDYGLIEHLDKDNTKTFQKNLTSDFKIRNIATIMNKSAEGLSFAVEAYLCMKKGIAYDGKPRVITENIDSLNGNTLFLSTLKSYVYRKPEDQYSVIRGIKDEEVQLLNII